MKTFKIFLFISTLLIISSCNKEELYAPIEEQTTENTSELEATKARIKACRDPNLSFRMESSIYPFNDSNAYLSSPIVFNNEIWKVNLSDGGRVFLDDLYDEYDPEYFPEVEIWSSTNGTDWRLRATDIFWPRDAQIDLVVHDNKLWALGGYKFNTDIHHEYPSREVWNTSDGINWQLVSSNVPFVEFDSVISYNNRIFVFGAVQNFYEDPNYIYSSVDGIKWTQIYQHDSYEEYITSPFVFNNILFAKRRLNRNTYDLVYSKNGRSWTPISTRLMNSIRRFNVNDKAFAVYGNKVWAFGPQASFTKTGNTNGIWFSEDMNNWCKYSKGNNLPAPSAAFTTINFRNKLWFFSGKQDNSTLTREVWSMKESFRLLR